MVDSNKEAPVSMQCCTAIHDTAAMASAQHRKAEFVLIAKLAILGNKTTGGIIDRRKLKRINRMKFDSEFPLNLKLKHSPFRVDVPTGMPQEYYMIFNPTPPI